jgi:uncharacterized protein DUF4202
MNSIEKAKKKIREIISGSSIPEDPTHAENTLNWLLKFEPKADQALQIAALAHDIERANEKQKIKRKDYQDFDLFKQAHANNSAKILLEILEKCGVTDSITKEACRMVAKHEMGGDANSDLLKDADSISFFENNLPYYYLREGWKESKQRAAWGYLRISKNRLNIVRGITYEDKNLFDLVKQVTQEADSDESFFRKNK